MQESEYLSRAKGARWFEFTQKETVLLLGAGGIGSHLALYLTRLGCDIELFDYDTFESHNITGQFVSKKQVGVNKAEAIKQLLVDYSPESDVSVNQKYVEDSMTCPYTFVGPDNMEARKLAFANWKKDLLAGDFGDYTDKAIFIDGRLGWDVFEIYCVTKSNMEAYEKTLHNDGDLPEMECTMKQTTYGAAMCTSMMANYFKNHIINVHNLGMTTVPFSTLVDLQMISIEYDEPK